MDFINCYWQQALYSLLTFVCCWATKTIRRSILDLKGELRLNSKGNKAALYNALFQEHRRIRSKGSITLAEKKNIEHIYDGYHGLGGNHTGTTMYDELMEMPINYDSEN